MRETRAGTAHALDSGVRNGIARSVGRARASGRTRWIAHVLEAEVDDALRCFAHAEARDRFFWQRVDADELYCAWGSVGEMESGGRSRFEDVRAWTTDVRERLDWVGCDRPKSAATFVGGFGFEEDTSASADWKAFPATRFILPEAIVERTAGRSRWVLFVRIEPGATVEAIESALKQRHEETLVANARGASPVFDLAGMPSLDVLSEGTNEWPPGPEYVVRADRSHAVFREQVRSAGREIETGRLAKVVLARSLCVEHDGDVEVVSFLERLRALYPTCTLIAIGRAQDTFLAATPETLVRVEGRRVETAALAGSAPRGRQPEEDRELARALVESEKENEEHAHVVDAIRAALAPRCEELEIPDKPRLRPLFGIQHLETPVSGRLSEPVDGGSAMDILELAKVLHPTPAVCGVPAVAAKAWLREFEGLERGWYAAPIGWLDVEGGGDFRVALRSALIRNGQGPAGRSGASRTLLFAGAGVVAGSEPERELSETRVKLRALLAPLTEI